MCTAKPYGHCTDTALSIDTRTNTKYWKVQQLTYNWYQDLQHHLFIPDRFFKKNMRSNLHYNCKNMSAGPPLLFSSLAVIATTTMISLAHLKVTFMDNILVSMY
jgi:hypothetical protein